MGRRSREIRERREKRAREARRELRNEATAGATADERAGELEEELKSLADGDAVFWSSPKCPDEVRVSNLEDILAFESVGSGTSLFEGLQEHGLNLPLPEKLDEKQSRAKVLEVMRALARLRIFLVGIERMSAREAYSKIFHETLWEGNYVEKRNPLACTFIDVSHSIPRREMLKILEAARYSGSVH